MHTNIVPQMPHNVNTELSQVNNVLALADFALEEWQEFREKWLATGDGLAWRRAAQALEDRAALLGEVNYVA